MKYNRKSVLAGVILNAILLTSCEQPEAIAPVRKNIEDAVFASGYLEQENNYTVSAKVDGILVSLPVKEGTTVGKKELIAAIENDVQHNQLTDALAVYRDAEEDASPNSPQLQHLQVQIEQAEEQLEFDAENYSRYKQLWAKKSVSQLDFEKAKLQYEAAQNNLRALRENYAEVEQNLRLNVERSLVQVNTQQSLLKDYRLVAEEAGQVIRVFKKRGELVRRGEAIAEIGSGAYVIKLFVSEDDIVKVNIGHPVAVNINTYPDQTFRATVTKIYPGFDEMEQSYIVEAQFKQLPEKLFSGTQLQANIETGSRKNALVIPTDFVSRGSYVLLESGEEKQIKIGSKNGAWTEVIAGISEEDLIVKPTK